jgi:hypothetical protein
VCQHTVQQPISQHDTVLGQLRCNYTGVTSAARINVKNVTFHPATEFQNFSLVPESSTQSVLPSAVYTIALSSVQECQAQAALQQACGFLFVDSYSGTPVGSCSPTAKRCCFLNPYLNCAKSANSGKFTRFGAATLGIFGSF